MLCQKISPNFDRELKFQQFIGPIVLINAGHSVSSSKASTAFHLWENDLKVCLEQYEKHFGTSGEVFLDFVGSILNFMTHTMEMSSSDNGI